MVSSCGNLCAFPLLSQDWTPETNKNVAKIITSIEPNTDPFFLDKLLHDEQKLCQSWRADRHPIVNLLAYLAENGWECIAVRLYESYWEDPSLLTKWTGYSWSVAPATGANAEVYKKINTLEKQYWLYRAHLFVTSHEKGMKKIKGRRIEKTLDIEDLCNILIEAEDVARTFISHRKARLFLEAVDVVIRYHSKWRLTLGQSTLAKDDPFFGTYVED